MMLEARPAECAMLEALEAKGSWSGAPVQQIRGEFLRAMLLGHGIQRAEGVRRAALPATGLRIEGAEITGELDLSDAMLEGGESLPRLAFLGCTMPSRILLARARLRGLSLEGCKLTELSAGDARLEDGLRLIRLASSEPDGAGTGMDGAGRCQIDFRNARIGGEVVIGLSRFAAPPVRQRAAPERQRAVFAVDLARAVIGGGVMMTPRVSARGGVTVAGARIAGDLILAGAELFGGEGSGLDANACEIGGSLTFRDLPADHPDSRPTEITGGFSFRGARIRVQVDLGGLRRVHGTLNGQNVECETDFILLTTSGQPCEIAGGVILSGMKLGGTLVFTGAQVRDGIDCQNARIGGDVVLGDMIQTRASAAGGRKLPFWLDTSRLSLSRTTVGGRLAASGIRVETAASLRDIKVEGDVVLSALQRDGAGVQPFTARDVQLDGARIQGTLDMSGAQVTGTLSARHILVAEDVLLSPWPPPDPAAAPNGANQAFQADEIDLTGAVIKGKLEINREPAQRPGAGPACRIRLSEASVRYLADGGGIGWGQDALLSLDGFRYERLDEVEGAAPPPAITPVWPRYRDWLTSLTPARPPAAAWERRRDWLTLQYPDRHPASAEYRPEVYERLARVFRESGDFQGAQRIISENLRLRRQLTSRAPANLVLLLYAFFFDSGLSPKRAVATFMAWLLFGTLAISLAQHSWFDGVPALVMDTPAVRTVMAASGNAIPPAGQGITFATAGIAKAAEDVPCGDLINPLVYALDMEVPGLDLHERGKCTGSTELGWWWPLFTMLYSIIGSIVTAITILTTSGILRNNLEGR